MKFEPTESRMPPTFAKFAPPPVARARRDEDGHRREADVADAGVGDELDPAEPRRAAQRDLARVADAGRDGAEERDQRRRARFSEEALGCPSAYS
jgi:hypothetical protein